MDNSVFEQDAQNVLNNVNLDYIQGKSILITGASGLIGFNLLYSIKKYIEISGENQTTVYIVVHSGLPKHLDFVPDCGWITLLKGDLTDEDFLKDLPEFDMIFHLACYGQPSVFMSDAEKTLTLNTTVVFHLLNKVRKNGKFIFASSSAVYTGCTQVPFKEENIGNSNTDHPRACYIEGKKCGETICNIFRNKGTDAKSIRFGITYGPGTKPGDKRALNMFVESAVVNKKINLLDDGSAIKNYLYISDAVELIWKICLNGTHAYYNVAGCDKITILELAKKIGKYLNVEVRAGESANGGIKGAITDEELSMERANTEFSKISYVDIDTGLSNVIRYYLTMFQ